MGRYKTLIGPRLRARGFAAQENEGAIGVTVLNRMLAAGRLIRPSPTRNHVTGWGWGHLALHPTSAPTPL
jgi:hypothetical protein